MSNNHLSFAPTSTSWSAGPPSPLGEVLVDEHSVSMVFVVFLQSGSRAVDGVAQSLRAESNDHLSYAWPPFVL